ncbi:methyltransferase [Aureococcus anophagefferens]|nr:methyltransferase [Aureococcus anophagefferens]
MFGSPGFWDERYYVNCEPFEWYHDYAALKPLLEQFMTKEMHILLVGCGRVVVDEMAMRYESISKKIKKKKKKKGEASMKEIPKMYFEDDLGGIQWKQADATDLTAMFNDKIFDVVVDKALLDALYCSEVPGKQTHKYLQEMDRILTPEGLFFCVSFGLPENRLDKIEDTDEESDGFLAWEVEVHAIPKLMPNQYKVSQLKPGTDRHNCMDELDAIGSAALLGPARVVSSLAFALAARHARRRADASALVVGRRRGAAAVLGDGAAPGGPRRPRVRRGPRPRAAQLASSAAAWLGCDCVVACGGAPAAVSGATSRRRVEPRDGGDVVRGDGRRDLALRVTATQIRVS